MVARVSTVAFQGIEGVPVEVQVMVAPGKTGMQIVGLPDKAVAESRERVQAALHASGLALPAKRVTVNLAPADLPKEGVLRPHKISNMEANGIRRRASRAMSSPYKIIRGIQSH